MKRRTRVTLVLTTTLLLLNTAIAQQIINDKPTPSRAEGAPLGYAYGRDYSTSDVTKVVVLGSGTPAADTRHSGISVAVVVNDQPYVIDCGPGFWRNSQASTPAYGGKIAALEPQKLTRLFLTHLHFDHTEGMSEFMLAPWVYNRGRPQVYGPPGTENMVDHLMKAYAKDIYIQMFGLEALNATGWKWLAKEVLPGEVYKDDNVRITAYQNKHGSWDYSYAYRVVTYKPNGSVDRTIVFSGDTALFDGMEEVYAGADIRSGPIGVAAFDPSETLVAKFAVMHKLWLLGGLRISHEAKAVQLGTIRPSSLRGRTGCLYLNYNYSNLRQNYLGGTNSPRISLSKIECFPALA